LNPTKNIIIAEIWIYSFMAQVNMAPVIHLICYL